MTHRIVPALCLALCLVPQAHVACGQQPLRVVTFFAEFMPGLRALAEDYHELTGTRVQVQGIPYPMHQMWVRTQFLSGSPPDVLILEGTDLAWQFGQAGMLQRVDPLLDHPNRWDARYPRWGEFFDEGLIQRGQDATGALWALPFTQYRVGFFYNSDVYRQLSLEEPRTWSELIANFERVRHAGLPAMAVAVKPNDAQSLWMSSLLLEYLLRPHAQLINLRHAEGWSFDANDPLSTIGENIDLAERIVAFERGLIDPAMAEPFRVVAGLIKEFSETWRPDFLSLDGEQIFTLFAGGRATHMMNGTWYVRELRELQASMRQATGRPAFEWSVFPFPELDETSTSLPRIGSMAQNAGMRASVLIARQSEPSRTDRSLAFVEYLTAPPVVEKFFRGADIYDPSALKDVGPHPDLAALLRTPPSATLGLASFAGYDAQAASEFWTLWQMFLGERIGMDGFLRDLSAAHRRSLQRLAVRHLGEEDHRFIEHHFGHPFP